MITPISRKSSSETGHFRNEKPFYTCERFEESLFNENPTQKERLFGQLVLEIMIEPLFDYECEKPNAKR